MRPGPVAVIVLSHRDPPLVTRLVDRLRSGRDVFVAVHHDPAGPPLALPAASNVAAVPDPRHCPWGRIDLALTMRRALGWVLDTVPELSWALLVSGQDYPTRSMTAVADELQASEADAYLRIFRLDDPAHLPGSWPARARRRYLRRRRLPFTHRSLPMARPLHPYRRGVHLYGGGVWFNLSREAAGRVVEAEALAARLERFLRWSPNPDETFVHTLLGNNSVGLRLVNDHRRYLRWRPGHHGHPEILGPEDLPAITAGDAFFARKVSAEHAELLDRLDELAQG